jgi:hypothetical protein
MMQYFFSLAAFIAIGLPAFAQKSKITRTSKTTSELQVPMVASRWNFQAGKVEFLNHKGIPGMKISSGYDLAILKDFIFSNGTIEFDVEPLDAVFSGIYFRMEDRAESEYFYLRVARAGNPSAMDAVQYTPFSKGVNLWDLFGYYQGPASIKKNAWNHIKLIVSGKQMIAFVNDTSKAVLQIPRLEGNTQSGTLAFNGNCIVSNLIIKSNEVEGLPAREGFDPTYCDPRYLRAWQVSDPQPLPKGQELHEGELPGHDIKWQSIIAERRGLINLTRVFGDSPNRRFVWVKVKLIATVEQKRRIDLGFSDEVWVFLNKLPVFTDKNIYRFPDMRKNPDGRISVENSAFDVTLKAGENELLIGIANDFYGWGIISRLDTVEGIRIEQ